MRPLSLKIGTAWRLGAANIWRALFYRLGLRLGWNPVNRIEAEQPTAPFFGASSSCTPLDNAMVDDRIALTAFGLPADLDVTQGPPDWHKSIITGGVAPTVPWWQIADFVDGLGDIKGVWEVSRFDWLLAFARRAEQGDGGSLDRINTWLQDWCKQNPPYLGANWKCGQEASIRVMHVAMSARLLGQVRAPAQGLIALLRAHLKRIAPTIQYAIAQDNNHGTSEAAALFIGGSWLVSLSEEDRDAHRWMRQGRRWLENRAKRLIEEDGSFSQYSINYHRVMLDTYSMAEIWRRALELPEFSGGLVRKLKLATAWLGNMVSPDGGDTPNLGANDGARLLPLADTDYRDVRPSVQLASVLFAGKLAYPKPGPYDQPLHLLKLQLPSASASYSESRQYDQGGYVVLRKQETMALFRYPRFRFRPGQSDLLHVDFWRGGLNVFRDAGSYSYNCDEPWQSYFPGSEAHNTVQFDGRDAMPRLGRFLFGAWPKARAVVPLSDEQGQLRAGAGYRDWKGVGHHRSVSLTDNSLTILDEISGFEKAAVLRWRLAPGEWHWESKGDGDVCLLGHGCRLRVKASQTFVSCELVEGWESRYYSRKTPLPVLEVEVAGSGKLITELTF